MRPKHQNFPFDDVVKKASEMVASGFAVHQKFTCAGCGARQTIAVPNSMFRQGSCEECKHITNIEKDGCNYLIIGRTRAK